MSQILIKHRLLEIAAEFRSTETHRPCLSNVYVQPYGRGKIILTATDGHKLISLMPSQGACRAKDPFSPFLLPTEAIKNVKSKTTRRETLWCVIDTKDKKLFSLPFVGEAPEPTYIIEKGLSTFFEPFEHPFLDWRRCVPSAQAFAASTHNRTSVAPKHFKSLAIFEGAVHLFISEDGRRVGFHHATEDYTTFGLLCTHPVEEEDSKIPEWVYASAPTSEAEDLV